MGGWICGVWRIINFLFGRDEHICNYVNSTSGDEEIHRHHHAKSTNNRNYFCKFVHNSTNNRNYFCKFVQFAKKRINLRMYGYSSHMQRVANCNGQLKVILLVLPKEKEKFSHSYYYQKHYCTSGNHIWAYYCYYTTKIEDPYFYNDATIILPNLAKMIKNLILNIKLHKTNCQTNISRSH